jgi:AGZA family xanthine/uracil permease-like MFS transporter
MILSAATVAVIERRFVRAGLWMLLAAALAAAGLVHGHAYTPGDTVLRLGPAVPWAVGYLAVAALFLAARWITVPGDSHG